jgi:hypothetical protein
MEVNPLLKYATSVPAKYYTGAVESQERIEGFWSFGAQKYFETQRHREHREEEEGESQRERERGGRGAKHFVLAVPFRVGRERP